MGAGRPARSRVILIYVPLGPGDTDIRTADADMLEAVIGKVFTVILVAEIENNPASQVATDHFPIGAFVFAPLGEQDQTIGVGKSIICFGGIMEPFVLANLTLEVLGRFRIMARNGRPSLE